MSKLLGPRNVIFRTEVARGQWDNPYEIRVLIIYSCSARTMYAAVPSYNQASLVAIGSASRGSVSTRLADKTARRHTAPSAKPVEQGGRTTGQAILCIIPSWRICQSDTGSMTPHGKRK